MRHPAQGATGGWVMPGLIFKWFPLCEFSLFDTPKGEFQARVLEWGAIAFSLSCIGEGKGNPLQCSCLENPRDRGAWLTAIYGVAQSRT